MQWPTILPWQKHLTRSPLEKIVHEINPADRRNLARFWREAKLAELSFVGLTSALVTGAYASANGWQTVGTIFPYVLGIWYGGLILVLCSISLAAHQSIALYRLTASDDGLDFVCMMLGYDGTELPTPSRIQEFAWQMPVMLLNISIQLFVLGMLVHVFHMYRATNENVEQLILTVIALITAVVLHVFSHVSLYSKI
ncbi:hypothetical protein BDV96DRAFT_685665 [Lophiotrema nucula]|uniref:Uncharacterized protein n=1 Tax=Lophiotrema nucula TaxID=690887 RepID=A0A6A5ZF16_9PLEO|nr:hypothetical protein BDV96DRAFT_685665 [Lophiotrema nucula]